VNKGLLPALLLLLPLLAGCFGAAGVPLPAHRLGALRDQFEELDRLDRPEIDVRLQAMEEQAARLAESKHREDRAELAHKRLLIGYCWERRAEFVDAQRAYHQAASSEYGSVAYFRIAQVGEHLIAQARANSENPALSPTRGTRPARS